MNKKICALTFGLSLSCSFAFAKDLGSVVGNYSGVDYNGQACSINISAGANATVVVKVVDEAKNLHFQSMIPSSCSSTQEPSGVVYCSTSETVSGATYTSTFSTSSTDILQEVTVNVPEGNLYCGNLSAH